MEEMTRFTKETINELLVWYAQSFPKRINATMQMQCTACDEEKKEIALTFSVQEWQLNPVDSLHGGITATAFDMSFGLLVRALSGQKDIATVNMAVTYLLPIRLQDTVHIKARALMSGKTLVSLSGEAYVNEDDRPAASSSATFILLKRRATNV